MLGHRSATSFASFTTQAILPVRTELREARVFRLEVRLVE